MDQRIIDNIIYKEKMRSLLSTSDTNIIASSAFISNQHKRAITQASLSTVFDKHTRFLSGSLCLTGDTMEGIIQLLVFLKAFSVSCYFFN